MFYKLPDVEETAAKVHEAWMAQKIVRGIKSHKIETGEECMVPYSELSEAAKELDRTMVKAIFAIIKELNAKGEA